MLHSVNQFLCTKYVHVQMMSSLSEISIHYIYQILCTLFVIVSQRTFSIQQADQIIVLDDGAVAGVGTHQQLLDSCQVYREIYDSQFKKEARA